MAQLGTKPACSIHGSGNPPAKNLESESADPAESSLDADAANLSPTAELPGRILVRWKYKDGPHAGEQRTAEELWSGAVFDSDNILT